MIEYANGIRDRLAEIHEYGGREFGAVRAREFIASLREKFELLAEFPRMGLDYGHLQTGLRRAEHAPYSIYYRQTARGIYIVRVLHQRQDPARHLAL